MHHRSLLCCNDFRRKKRSNDFFNRFCSIYIWITHKGRDVIVVISTQFQNVTSIAHVVARSDESCSCSYWICSETEDLH